MDNVKRILVPIDSSEIAERAMQQAIKINRFNEAEVHILYVADIKIRAMKGDNSPPVFNAYVVMSGSMLPQIKIKDIVVTKRVPEERLNQFPQCYTYKYN